MERKDIKAIQDLLIRLIQSGDINQSLSNSEKPEFSKHASRLVAYKMALLDSRYFPIALNEASKKLHLHYLLANQNPTQETSLLLADELINLVDNSLVEMCVEGLCGTGFFENAFMVQSERETA